MSCRLRGKREKQEKQDPASRASQSACLGEDGVEDGDEMRGEAGGPGNVLLEETETGTRRGAAVLLRMFISR